MTKMEAFETLPAMLRYVTHTYQNAQAFNQRQGSRWVSTSTESFGEQVRRLALGLVSLGLKRGQSVGILADPSPWWLMADMAILAAGGVSVPLFPNSSETNLRFKIQDAAIKFVFVCDQDSANSFRQHRRFFAKTILRDSDSINGPVMGDQRVMKLGDELSVKQPTRFRKLCDQARPDDIATIIYTSGSTGMPKGVKLTHRNFISQIHAAAQRFKVDCAADRALSALPLAHIFERMVVYYYTSQGVSVWFADNPKNVGDLITDVQPTCITVVPRLLEKIYAAMVAKVETANAIHKPLGRWAMKIAHSPNGRHGISAWRQHLANKVVFAKMRQALGGQLRIVICGGSKLSPRLCRFFWNIGVPVYQGYGLTESSPVITANSPGHNKIGTVGQPFPGVKVFISEQGEILAHGPNIMVGYHNNPTATTETIDNDGWLHTGDLGEIDSDGYLTITGRIKEQFKTATGKYVCPAPIEIALTASPYIDRAYVVAENKSFASCLLFPDTDQVRRLLLAKDSTDMPDDALIDTPELNQQIKQLLEVVNENLEPWERVRDYRLVTDELSVENGGLTPTQKIRRQILEERYKDLINSMYNNGVEVI